MTRSICVSTAKLLVGKWNSWSNAQKCWRAPTKKFRFKNEDLQETAQAGVAFHHAGLSSEDRTLIERMFLERELNIICCTSTLAIGVNLPTHLVVIKNTVTWKDRGTKEYVDLEIMQMLGRAGRPQFDDSGVAVIMTKKEQKQHYEQMEAGKEILESR
jgi:ATP-dependent DNA helicase HFM1/MER3